MREIEIARSQEAIEDAQYARQRSERMRAENRKLNGLLGEALPAPRSSTGRARAANKRARVSRRQNRRR